MTEQPDRDTAFTAWAADLPFTWGFEETAFAAGWDAATRAEQERILSAPLDQFGRTILSHVAAQAGDHGDTDRWDRGYRAAMRDVADLLGDDE